MPQILMVSKPVAPPWNDSSKNLVRDLASSFTRCSATILTRKGDSSVRLPGVAREDVYGRSAGGFAPALADNARVLARLLTGSPRHDLWHFFFAPNPRTSLVGRLASKARRVPTVQTMCSAPRTADGLPRLLFADRTVVLSEYSEQRVIATGVPVERVRRIPPAVAPLQVPDDAARQAARARFGLSPTRPLVVYPGDLEFSMAAERVLRAHAQRWRSLDAQLAIACRAKTPLALERERALRALATELKVESSVVWLGEIDAIHALLGTADVVALPAETLYAKMDLPLVLIEAMLLQRCTLVARDTPAAELAAGDAALSVTPEVDAIADAVAELIADPARRAALGARARAAALDRFHPTRVASAYEALYDELLA